MGICNEIAYKEAESVYGNYDYALIYYLSEVYLGKIKKDNSDIKIDWDECIEARFFSEKGELHIFRDDESGEIKFVVIEDTNDSDYDTVIKKYAITPKFKFNDNGMKLDVIKVKEYISYDEDGQAYVVHTRLAGVERRV